MHEALAARGEWVFGGGLHDPDTATVVSVATGSPVMTDGPFIDTKEVIGGFSIIDVAAFDVRAAVGGAHVRRDDLPDESRPFAHSTLA